MTSPFFGFIFNENTTDVLTPVTSDFSIVGLVLPSDDANAAVFPLNKPVSGNSGDSTFLAAIGTGPLYKAILRINAQLGDLQASAQVVIVRVATAKNSDGSENVAGTIANIVGNPAAGTGLYALPKASQICNITPRLIGATGYTGVISNAVAGIALLSAGHDFTNPVVTFNPPGATATATVGNAGVQATAHAVLNAGAIGNIVVDNGGQDYLDGVPTVTISGGGGAGATAHAVMNASGAVDHIAIDNPGSGFTSLPSVAIGAPAPGEITGLTLTNPGSYAPDAVVTATIADSNGGVGTGATVSVTLELLDNPICAALPPVLDSLLGVALVGGPGTTKAAALAFRGLLNSKRLIAQDDWEIVQDPTVAGGTGTAYIDGAARSLGLAVRTDFQHGGYPFYAWANVPVQGALGLKRVDSFSLLDGATDGQELLAAGVGITVRGDLSDTSLDESGYIAVSVNDTSGNFYNKTRGRDFIDLTLLKTIRKILGGNNITPHSVQAVLTAMSQVMVNMPSDGVVGYQIGFNSSDNSIAGLRAGKFTVYDNSEEAAPICQITINRALDDAALTSELGSLASAGTGS